MPLCMPDFYYSKKEALIKVLMGIEEIKVIICNGYGWQCPHPFSCLISVTMLFVAVIVLS